MQTYYIMLICGTIVPLLMLICGLFLFKFPPKNRNAFVGYRTKASMQSDESWNFAQKLCGKIWIRLGLVMIFATIAAMVLLPDKSEAAVSKASMIVMIVQMALMLLSIIPVELTIRKRFGNSDKEK